MAAVYLARDERLDRQVAVKVLAPGLAGEAAFRTRLLRESLAAAALGHPHIIPVYEAGDAAGILYVAMRYVPGGDTRSLLRSAGPLPAATAWSILAQAASALDAAHARGLIHRDVKPANMLLEAGPSGPREAGRHLFLTDFGMGADTSAGEVSTAVRRTGSFDYLAPEQIEGRALDGRTDLYSLACSGFELLCGTPPFEQDEPLTVMYAQLYAPPPSAKARRDDLPAAVDRVLATALAKNPADRYGSCGQFAEELFRALGLAGPRVAPARSRPWDQAGPGAPEASLDQLLDGPGQLIPESMSRELAPERPPRPPRQSRQSRRSGGIRLGGVTKIILAIAAAAIVAAVVLGVTAANRTAPVVPAASLAVPPPTPSLAPSPAPASPALAPSPAVAVNDVLDSSAATVTALRAAVAEVFDCSNLSTAVSQIQDTARQRSAEYSRASALPFAALADGTAVKSGLIAVLRTSLDADRDYLSWARQQLNLGCSPSGQSSAYGAAANAAGAASAAKNAFVQVWNPVAAKYGVPQRSAGSI